MSSTFSGISGYYTDDLSEISGPLPERLTMALVAPRFLDVLEVPPVLGRNFTRDEFHFGGPAAVIISNHLWQRRFAGDPAILTKKTPLWRVFLVHRRRHARVVCVSQSRHRPLGPQPARRALRAASRRHLFTVFGRMKSGVTFAHAQADMATVQSRLGQQFPKPDADLTVQSAPLKETIVSEVRDSLWLLYGSVTLLLLIACSNIAALLLARTADREHENLHPLLLGASRRAIVGQLLTEVFALALLGSLLGLAIAAGATRAFHLLANTLPRASEINLNPTIVLYSLLCAVATTLLCGLFPALRGTRRDLAHSLAQTGRTQTSARNPLQWFLVAVQVTLAVTLLTGAGLLLRSLQQLSRVHPGFDPSHVLTFQISGSWGETADMPALNRRIDSTLDTIRTIPGVQSAATSAILPGIPSLYQVEFNLDGSLDPNRKILADNRWVSWGYFDTTAIPLLQGEACRRGGPPSDVLVNRAFASLYLSGAALGHNIAAAAYNDFSTKGQIRGVVGDAREAGLNLALSPRSTPATARPLPSPTSSCAPMAIHGHGRNHPPQHPPN